MDTRTNAERCRVRLLEEADRHTLRLIFLTTRRSAFRWMSPDELKISEFDTATADELVLVADTDGQVVGFVSIWQPEDFIHNLFVSPEWQNRGIGTQLLSAAGTHIGRPAHLKCSIHNERARAFYEARGWTVASRGGSRANGYLNMECARPATA
ncbi:GNAT family N-acetyltransferase [Cognatazoarcus halotolerans]|uniref:GNAT family N-acetyltransferase n=1 Tax=Cognatazoarcus halotolerans TaxID=2686016 RepID=UPI00135B8740|nr:GNAT family N-acetyltransferase [Cognatazoarcus halotolerans]